ncbi:Uncharacterised protein g6424 [Pycnogonum litorale]
MDKYLVKLKKETPCVENVKRNTEKRQAKLKNMKGVVIIENFRHYESKLTNKSTSIQEIKRILVKLTDKKPAKEIIKSTNIGRAVHKLCHHNDSSVAEIANKVYLRWKQHVQRVTNRPLIEIPYDDDTLIYRKNAKKFLSSALETQSDDLIVAEIEKIIFEFHEKLTSRLYRKDVRRIYLKLKGNENLIKELKCDSTPVKSIIVGLLR